MRKFTAEETEIRNQLIEHLEIALRLSEAGDKTLMGVQSNIKNCLFVLITDRKRLMPLIDPKKYGHWAKKESKKKTVKAKSELVEAQTEAQETETLEAETKTTAKKKPGRKAKENNRGQSCC